MTWKRFRKTKRKRNGQVIWLYINLYTIKLQALINDFLCTFVCLFCISLFVVVCFLVCLFTCGANLRRFNRSQLTWVPVALLKRHNWQGRIKQNRSKKWNTLENKHNICRWLSVFCRVYILNLNCAYLKLVDVHRLGLYHSSIDKNNTTISLRSNLSLG